MYQTNPAKDFLTQIPLRGNKNCKPVSRILLHPVVWDCYHLSGIAIADYLYLPTLPASAESGLNEPFKRRDIRGISARKVYPNITISCNKP